MFVNKEKILWTESWLPWLWRQASSPKKEKSKKKGDKAPAIVNSLHSSSHLPPVFFGRHIVKTIWPGNQIEELAGASFLTNLFGYLYISFSLFFPVEEAAPKPKEPIEKKGKKLAEANGGQFFAKKKPFQHKAELQIK